MSHYHSALKGIVSGDHLTPKIQGNRTQIHSMEGFVSFEFSNPILANMQLSCETRQLENGLKISYYHPVLILIKENDNEHKIRRFTISKIKPSLCCVLYTIYFQSYQQVQRRICAF